MKNILSLFVLVCLIVSCGPKNTDDLKGKKELLKTKKTELASLKVEINTLKEEIEKLSPKREKKVTLVSTVQAKKRDYQQFADIQASIVSDDMVNASSETGGRILSLRVKEGSYVKKGQLLATIDLETIDKQIDELQTSLELATTVYERQERLWNQKIGSEMQFLQAKNNKERLDKNLEILRAQLKKKNVYSPITGVVDKEFLQQGEIASPGMPIVQIINTRKVKAIADVPESYLGKVKRGDMVTISFPALDKEVKQKISMLGRSIDPSNRTFKVEIDIPNQDGILKPNLLANVSINTLSLKDVVVVPTYLIQQEVSGKDYIYQVIKSTKDTTAKKIYVSLGQGNNEEVVITEGLQGDELLINEGARNIADGVSIKLSQN